MWNDFSLKNNCLGLLPKFGKEISEGRVYNSNL